MNKYSVIHVLHDDAEFKKHLVVPLTFICQNDVSKVTHMRIMALPYSKDDIEGLTTFILSQAQPPHDWPLYKCRIIKETGAINWNTFIILKLYWYLY